MSPPYPDLLPPRRTGMVAPARLVERRAASLAAPGGYSPHPLVEVREQCLGGIRCLVLSPPEAVGTLVYFHGGGFRLGSIERTAPFASHLAFQGGCRILLPAYGLAPENPFPGALRDGVEVIRAVSGEWVVGGDSAGGNLAAVLARIETEPVGAALRGTLLFSPWVDLTASGSSYRSNAQTDSLFSRAAALEAADLYLQGHPANDALASPVFAETGELPATLIVVGGTEVLLHDSLAFAAKLADANAEVSLHSIPNMKHVAVTLSPDLYGARYAIDLAADFLRRRFGREGVALPRREASI